MGSGEVKWREVTKAGGMNEYAKLSKVKSFQERVCVCVCAQGEESFSHMC